MILALTEAAKDTTPLITNDKIVFGLLMLCLGFVFYTSSKKEGPWAKFYKYVPALFMAYFVPAILTTTGLIAPEWVTVTPDGEEVKGATEVYHMASRYLLPAAIVLLTLSLDLKGVFNLGPKALWMFFAATIGIIIGGPIAIMIVGTFSPETVGGADFDAVWRGLSTLAGSWIGGSANQNAMLEIYEYNQNLYGQMVFVDILVANVWMAIILIGIGKSKKIDKWLKADNSAIEELKEKMTTFTEKVSHNPTLSELMILGAIAFGAVGFSHWLGDIMAGLLSGWVDGLSGLTKNVFTFLGSSFFWMVSIATLIGVFLSYTKARNLEGAGASKIGSVFIYILVATIGMKMDLMLVFENPGLILVGFVWMAIHAGLLIGTAKLIRAPYFFLAVGSQANVGGAASAPVVASAFHSSLTTVGVLLAVFGYAIGTLGAVACTFLMQLASAYIGG